jgi:hypothetical protein
MTSQEQCPPDLRICPHAVLHQQDLDNPQPHFVQPEGVPLEPFRKLLRSGQRGESAAHAPNIVRCALSPPSASAFSVQGVNAASISHARNELQLPFFQLAVRDQYNQLVYTQPSFQLERTAEVGDSQSRNMICKYATAASSSKSPPRNIAPSAMIRRIVRVA